MTYYKTRPLLITLDPGGDERRFICDMIQDVPQTISKDAISMAMPGADYRKNILMGLSGMESDISINFYVQDDGTDRADGTLQSGDCDQMISGTDGQNFWHDGEWKVITVPEQLHYLRRVIFDPSFDGKWELTNPGAGDLTNWDQYDFKEIAGVKPFNNLEVFVENTDLTWMNRESPKWRICRIDLIVGEGI